MSVVGSTPFLAPLTSNTLSFQFSSLKHTARLLFKLPEAMAQRRSYLLQNGQGGIRVHAKLGKSVPMCQIKQNLANVGIMRFGEKSIKYGYCTLSNELLKIMANTENKSYL